MTKFLLAMIKRKFIMDVQSNLYGIKWFLKRVDGECLVIREGNGQAVYSLDTANAFVVALRKLNKNEKKEKKCNGYLLEFEVFKNIAT